MCGICGFITKRDEPISVEDYRRFKQLLILNEQRGTDSTGIAYVDENNEVVVIKEACKASKFILQLPKYIKTKLIIGHTRLATRGAVNKQNAHPFVYGDIVGIHNGVVYNHAQIGEFNVDSEAIFYLLNKHKKKINNAFRQLSGMFALAWINKLRTDRLYLTKAGNPLFLVETESGYFFHSIENALNLVLLDYIVKKHSVKSDNILILNTRGEKEKYKAFFKKYNYDFWFNGVGYGSDNYYYYYTDSIRYNLGNKDRIIYSPTQIGNN